MRGVLNTISIEWLMFFVAAVTLGVILLAVWAVRRWVPATREGFHAEISAPMLGVVGALFGLLLAFVIVIGYQNLLDADANVNQEADALSSIVRDSEAFPYPGGADVRHAVGDYVRVVVNHEWHQMRDTGQESPRGERELDDIAAALRTVTPTSSAETAFYQDAVNQLNVADTARADRLEKAEGGLPSDLVDLLIFSSLVIIGYSVFVGSPNYWFHALGPAAIAVVVVVSLVVLLDLAYPFSGVLAVSPEHFTTGELARYFPPR